MKTSAPAITSANEPLRPVAEVVSSASARLESFMSARAGVQDAAPVGDGDVADARRQQDAADGDAGGAGAGDHDPGGLHQPAGEPQRVLQRGEHDDRRTVLVVVEDGDVEALLEPVLDLEAARRGDVLEVDAAEARRESHDRLDDLVDVGGVEADRHGVDATELLEEDGLPLHDRHRGPRPDVAEAEDGGAVGDDGHRVGHPGVLGGQRLVLGDRLADPGDARRVGQRELLGAVQGDPRGDLHLPPDVQGEGGVVRAGVLEVRHGVRIVTQPAAGATAEPRPRRAPGSRAPHRPTTSRALRSGCRASPTSRRA